MMNQKPTSAADAFPEPVFGAYRPPFIRLMNTQEDCDRAYRLFAEAGLNMMVCGLDGGEKSEWVIRACEKYGIRMLLNLPRGFYSGDFEYDMPLVRRLLASSAFYAFNMLDEPRADQFEALAEAKRRIESVMPPDKFAMANLFPNCLTSEQLKVDPARDSREENPYALYSNRGRYDEYVRLFVETVQPRALCFDHYPISYECRENPAEEYVRNHDFIANIAAMRIRSRIAGLPFFSIVQMWGYNKNKPAPNLYEARWQVNANYVFGGACTIYFVYQNSYPEGTGPESWVDAPVDYDGNLTPQYDILKRTNAEFRAFAGVFHTYTHVGMMLHNPLPYLPYAIPPELMLGKFGPLRRVDGDGSLVIGCMEKNGNPGLYVMNGSYKTAADAVVKLDCARSFEVWGRGGRENAGTGDGIPVSLERGEAKFIVL